MTFLFSFPSDQIEVLYSYYHITRVLVMWWWGGGAGVSRIVLGGGIKIGDDQNGRCTVYRIIKVVPGGAGV